jgi:SAM-dependent methyltransferase
MAPLPYYRDTWVLSPNQKGYPGAFPEGFIPRVKARWWGRSRLWMFSGSFKDRGGVTVDINPAVSPDIIANCEALPFEDASFDFVLLDPPYSEAEARDLYGLDYCSITKVFNEAARVTRPGGTVLVLHRIVPFCHPYHNDHVKNLQMVGLVGVCTLGGYTNSRMLSVWRKRETMQPFLEAAASQEAYTL